MNEFICSKINPTDENLERVGRELAIAVGWSGDSIMRVALAALTEANFHELRERLERAYEEVEGGLEMNDYLVTLHEEKGDKFTLFFECQAEDFDHAEEQALNAYPLGEVVNIVEGVKLS